MTALLRRWYGPLPRVVRIRLALLLLAVLLFLTPFLGARTRQPLPHGRGGTSAAPLTRPADPPTAPSAAFAAAPTTTVRPRIRTPRPIPSSPAVAAKKAPPVAAPVAAPRPAAGPVLLIAAKPTEGPDR